MPLHSRFYYVAWKYTSTNRLILLINYRFQQSYTKHFIKKIQICKNEKEAIQEVKNVLLDIISNTNYNVSIILSKHLKLTENPLVKVFIRKTNPILRSLYSDLKQIETQLNSEIYKQSTVNKDWNNELKYYKNSQ